MVLRPGSLGVQSNVMMSVCVPDCIHSHNSKTAQPNFSFFVRVSRGRVSILL